MCLKEDRGHTLLQDERPAALVAWREVDHAPQTAFAAHESSFSRSTARFCKKHIRRIQALCGNLPIHSYSWSYRPEVVPHFGFKERERGKVSSFSHSTRHKRFCALVRFAIAASNASSSASALANKRDADKTLIGNPTAT